MNEQVWQVGFVHLDGSLPSEAQIRATLAEYPREGLSLVEPVDVDSALWLVTLPGDLEEELQTEGCLETTVGRLMILGEMP